MGTYVLKAFEEILEPLGAQSVRFFLAVSLYHSEKVSFQRAAQLSGLSFEEFKAGLKEHFSTGYVLFDEIAMSDLDAMENSLSDR